MLYIMISDFSLDISCAVFGLFSIIFAWINRNYKGNEEWRTPVIFFIGIGLLISGLYGLLTM